MGSIREQFGVGGVTRAMELSNSVFKGRPDRPNWYERNRHWFFYLILMAAIVMVGAAGGLAIRSSIQKENRLVFAAWVKLTDRNDITFEEWDLMRRNRVLPNNLSK